MERDYRSEARAVVRLAGASKEYPAAAAVIRGAINDVYERTAEDALRKTTPKAEALGLSVEEQHEQIAVYLLLGAAEAGARRRK